MPVKKPRLTVSQLEIVGQFSDYAFDHSPLYFDATAKKVGVKFPATPTGRKFQREAKAVFDREREERAE
jgi:hypothetical protein